MALSAGRYGVTKRQLNKVKNLPIDTIGMIESIEENKCDNSVVALVENDTTASQDYAVNDIFIRNDDLCKVTSPISQGDTLSDQFTVTTVGAILTALLNA